MSPNEKPAQDLDDEELEAVAGGVAEAPTTYLKIRFEDILISCVPGPDGAVETPPHGRP
jgi:hypothetical protein